MSKKYLLTIVFFISCSIFIFAQNKTEESSQDNIEEFSLNETEKYSKLPSVELGVGTLSYFGDLSINSDINKLSQVRTGYHLNIEKRLGNYIGVSINGLMGELSHTQVSNTSNLNFETIVYQAGLNLIAYIDNDIFINRKSLFTPFFSAGFGYMMFDPKGDLTDAGGNPYYYWKDGSIRNTPETDTTLLTSKIIQRDYTYETTLKDSLNNYARNTFSIPLTAGLKFKLSNSFDVNIAAAYHLTQSDFLDNIKGNNEKDNFLYTSCAIQYNLGYGKKSNKHIYESVDFTALDKFDYDEDGVLDINDKCQNTPIGLSVDSLGCPLDTDRDGVPDYLDQQDTYKGVMVDARGVALNDEMIAEQLTMGSSAADRLDVPKPSMEILREIDAENTEKRASGSTNLLPAKFRSADLNNDGYISANEITAAIDSFFSGESDYNVGWFNKLIDYFFEQ